TTIVSNHGEVFADPESGLVLQIFLQAELNRQAISPTILVTSRGLNLRVQIRVARRFEDAAYGFPARSGQSDGYRSIRNNILNPVSPKSVLSENVEASVAFDKPDFDFAWKSSLAAGGR